MENSKSMQPHLHPRIGRGTTIGALDTTAAMELMLSSGADCETPPARLDTQVTSRNAAHSRSFATGSIKKPNQVT